MEVKRKQPKKPRIVTKPYLTGSLFDQKTAVDALKFFGGMLAMALLFLMTGAILIMDNLFIRIVLNTAILLLAYVAFYIMGVGKGTNAVTLGEMLYTRKENGRSVSAKEQSLSYHPLKGFAPSLLGTLPFLVCAILLALTAQLQLTGLGGLPSWVSAMTTREEIADPLAFYAVATPLTLESIVRLPVRMLLMPVVGLIGTENASAMLLMERLSPLFMLLPPVSYGLGYTRGVSMRTKVHTSIAANNRKRVKREKKQLKARMERKPQQLN